MCEVLLVSLKPTTTTSSTITASRHRLRIILQQVRHCSIPWPRPWWWWWCNNTSCPRWWLQQPRLRSVQLLLRRLQRNPRWTESRASGCKSRHCWSLDILLSSVLCISLRYLDVWVYFPVRFFIDKNLERKNFFSTGVCLHADNSIRKIKELFIWHTSRRELFSLALISWQYDRIVCALRLETIEHFPSHRSIRAPRWNRPLLSGTSIVRTYRRSCSSQRNYPVANLRFSPCSPVLSIRSSVSKAKEHRYRNDVRLRSVSLV